MCKKQKYKKTCIAGCQGVQWSEDDCLLLFCLFIYVKIRKLSFSDFLTSLYKQKQIRCRAQTLAVLCEPFWRAIKELAFLFWRCSSHWWVNTNSFNYFFLFLFTHDKINLRLFFRLEEYNLLDIVLEIWSAGHFVWKKLVNVDLDSFVEFLGFAPPFH